LPFVQRSPQPLQREHQYLPVEDSFPSISFFV